MVGADNIAIHVTARTADGSHKVSVVRVPKGSSVSESLKVIAESFGQALNRDFVVKDRICTSVAQKGSQSYVEGLQWLPFDVETRLYQDRHVVAMHHFRGG